MNTHFTGILGVALAAGLFMPHAADAAFVTEAGVSTISPCPSFCGGGGAVFGSDFDGGDGVASAYAQVVDSNGSGQARAALQGPLALPELGIEAFSNPNSRVSASAAGMQSYVYTGAPSLISLDVTLSGDVFDPTEPPTFPDASLEAHVLVIVSSSDLMFSGHYPTFFFEVLPGTPDATVLAEANINFFSSGLFDLGTQSVTQTIDFTLDTGDSVYIWASLSGSGTRSGYADAFNSLTIAVSGGDVSGLQPVPVPAPLVLLASGLVAMLGTRRRGATSA